MKRIKAIDAVHIAFFAALIAIGAFIKIPNPIGGLVPITMQTAFVILAGLVLSPAKSLMSVVVYITLGLIGLPIFASGGGPSYIVMPSFGFLVGFSLAAPLTSYVFRLFKKQGVNAAIIAGLVGTISYYIIGLPYLYLICTFYLGRTITMQYLFVSCFLIFLPGDLITMLAAAFVSKRMGELKKLITSQQ